jgi:sialidase-1
LGIVHHTDADREWTWPVSRVVHDGPAAYSAMAVRPDGAIGLLYERGEEDPYEAIRFASFDLEWLKAAPGPAPR